MSTFRRRTRVIGGQVFEVVWDGRRGAPPLLPADYPAVDGSLAPEIETDELLPTDYPDRHEQGSISMLEIRAAMRDRSRRYAGGKESR